MKILLFLLMIPAVFAASCEDPFDGMVITKDTVLCSRSVVVPNSITIKENDVTLDCNGAILRGTGITDGKGIVLEGVEGVIVKNCYLINFNTAIMLDKANRNYMHDNTLLKNQIGIRLVQSFENRFINNADKSLVKPISAIASKFNSFWLSNKNLDKDFCDVNLCNEAGPMDPCVNDDLYCSPDCDYENDNDCKAPIVAPEPVQEEVKPAVAPKPVKKPVIEEETVSFMSLLPEKARFWVMAGLFIVAYLIGFLVFQHHHLVHSRNK